MEIFKDAMWYLKFQKACEVSLPTTLWEKANLVVRGSQFDPISRDEPTNFGCQLMKWETNKQTPGWNTHGP